MPPYVARSRHLLKLKELMDRVFVAFVLFSVLASAKTYTHLPEDVTYYDSIPCEHEGEWCGVDNGKWRGGERIVYYDYLVVDDIYIKNQTEIHRTHNCTGSLSSDGCTLTTVVENQDLTKERKKNITRNEKPYDIVPMPPELSLGLILTDNFDTTGNPVNETYPLLQDKHWQLNVPKGCRMNIIFNIFDVESTFQCKKDFFSVQTSKNQPNIHRYCHNLEEIEIRRRRRVQLTMHSDEAISRRGIHATVCISNLPGETVPDQDPCTCLQSSRRAARLARRRSIRSADPAVIADAESQREYGHLLKMRTEEEDKQVARWLRILMRGGQSAIDKFLANPVNIKQRKLAEHYQRAIEAAEDESYSLTR